jgi:hypothetical protein
MERILRTHEITEVEPGSFYTVLEPCSVAVLPHVLAVDASYVWVVEHRPDPAVRWTQLPVPLTLGGRPQALPVRDLLFDFQVSTTAFLTEVLPQLPDGGGIILLQLERPVPDTLRYRAIAEAPARHAVLRQNGWILTFDLPHGGEYAEVTTSDRRTLERILAEPIIASGRAAGELP